MSILEAMARACAEVCIDPPKSYRPGSFVRTNAHGKNGRGDGSVLVFEDETGGFAWNWQTQNKSRFTINGSDGAQEKPRNMQRARAAEREREATRRAVADLCGRIIKRCEAGPHPYLETKGFPDEIGLVLGDLDWLQGERGRCEKSVKSIPSESPLLIVPGRVGGNLTTLQFIAPDGAKKNIWGGAMTGAAHRIASGRETWVCEGLATALTIRAALRLLGRSATVLSAFSASNVAMVAQNIPGAIIAADNDKPVAQFGGMGTGEYYARKSGCRWVMPPERGDFNDQQISENLRDVALRLKSV